jgi:imidazolonepropionase-like amidohydrolase
MVAVFLTALTASTAVTAQTIAITGGTVVTVSGARIPNGTVIIRDSMIAAVGGADVAVPAGATRIDATGKIVTPGLINASAIVGLIEVGSVDGTNETSEHREVAASFDVAEGIDPASVLIPITRVEGVTSVLMVPSGSFVSGQSVFADLAGSTIEEMVAKNPVAMHVSLDEGAKGAGQGARAGTLDRLRTLLNDAREYARRKADFQHAQMQPLSAPAAELEALQPVLAGRLPLVISADRVFDIRSALRVAREFHLRVILSGAAEGWEIADEIARANVPVLMVPLSNIPSFDALGARYENAARLAAAGVKIAIVSGDQGHNARLMRQEAGNAVSYGLPYDAALRAVTLSPAEILGVQDRYGSLETGRIANVVVWSGDPFEFSTGVEHVFIRGREIPLTSRQTELLDRYRTLPTRQ